MINCNFYLFLKFNRPQWENISEGAKDLICKMLCLDPKKRLTIQEVLNHRWLRVCVIYMYSTFSLIIITFYSFYVRKEIRMRPKYIW